MFSLAANSSKNELKTAASFGKKFSLELELSAAINETIVSPVNKIEPDTY